MRRWPRRAVVHASALVLVAAALEVSGCRVTAPPPRLEPVTLRGPAGVPLDFEWRQRVTVTSAGRAPRAFEAVLHKQGDLLRLVGLTPLQTVLFVAEVRGREVRFENRTGEPLPFDGSHILRDVERAYFPWLEGPSDGPRQGRVFGVEVTETWAGGQLIERVLGAPGEAPVRVTFAGHPAPGVPGPPRWVTLVDTGRNYRLDIETASAE